MEMVHAKYGPWALDIDNVVASLVTFSTPWPNHRPSPKNPAGDGKFKGERKMTRGGNQQKKSKNLQHVPGPTIKQGKVRKLKGKQRQGQTEKMQRRAHTIGLPKCHSKVSDELSKPKAASPS